ncbi:MAG: hypothetical protein JWM47_2468 [Acidimicrobiales bacterium]|nr:hypothetical protein [Acidimicrobiales bacterium]
MQGVGREIVRRLDIAGALSEEAARSSTFLPPTPGLTELAEFGSDRLSTWLENQLRSGLNAQAMILVNARKPSHTTRPVPVLGIAERVTYRAVVNLLLGDEAAPERGSVAFANFIQMPLTYLREKATAGHPGQIGLTYGQLLNNPEVQYVVTSDISAFYQYIDHGVLAAELMRRSNEFGSIEVLIELLGSLSGRGFGLPQQNESSDRLSECIGELLLGALGRARFPAWRFNDDFRVGATSFAHALEAIEVLDEAARGLGLVVNDSKTRVFKIRTYFTDTLNVDADEPVADPATGEDAEDWVDEYTELFEDVENAAVLVDAMATQAVSNDFKGFGSPAVSRLRRALYMLGDEGNSVALRYLAVLAGFAPSATPSIARYLSAIGQVQPRLVMAAIRPMLDSQSLSEWQLAWLSHVIAELPPVPDLQAEVGDKLAALNATSRSPLLRATSALAASNLGSIDVVLLERMLLLEPSPMMPWYLAGVYRQSAASVPAERVLGGLRRGDELISILVESYQRASDAANGA